MFVFFFFVVFFFFFFKQKTAYEISACLVGSEMCIRDRVYANVGIFYRDITTAITEASDKGKYQPLFENLSELIDTVAMDDNETEIVRLELLELSRSAIQQYATKFKNDGISQTELDSMLDNIEVIAKSIDTTTDLTDEKKASITEFIGEAREAVELAYGTNKGEN